MGWSGSCNHWHNLPNMDTGYYDFNVIDECVYNIYEAGTGYIVSGKVTSDGNPIAGATVQSGTISATTDSKGN